MGRPKGGKNRRWTVEEKLRIVNRHLKDHISMEQVAREESISSGMLSSWVGKYLDGGEIALAGNMILRNDYTFVIILMTVINPLKPHSSPDHPP
jgi:transposase-like protein